MVDARMPEKYLVDRRVMRLSAEAFRAFVVLTMWSVSNRTDGLILADDLPLIPLATEALTVDLVAAELCQVVDRGWMLSDFKSTQTSRSELEILENNRRREREKKQRQRGTVRGEVPGAVPGDVSPGTAQARQGKARQGKEGPPLTIETDEEPNRFCEKHPRGGVSCGPCADARHLHELWAKAQKARPTPTPPRGPVIPECTAHPGYPLQPTCAACEREAHAA